MAVDDVLLESAAENRQCSLRFYDWSQPTLSLGYFQSHALGQAYCENADCSLVRRPTGGGAILHDRELTYSLATPTAREVAGDSSQLYLAVHGALVAALQDFGVHAELGCEPSERAPGEQPFLCFQRRARGDVLLDGWKVCGSAQRRRRNAILQHGSLLLARSPKAPGLPGIEDVTGKSLPANELVEVAVKAIAAGLRLAADRQGLTTAEFEAADRLVLAKYANPAWNSRR
jgi:lipoate-protein ligase A